MKALSKVEEYLLQELPFIPTSTGDAKALFDPEKWENLYVNPMNIMIFRGVKSINS